MGIVRLKSVRDNQVATYVIIKAHYVLPGLLKSWLIVTLRRGGIAQSGKFLIKRVDKPFIR